MVGWFSGRTGWCRMGKWATDWVAMWLGPHWVRQKLAEFFTFVKATKPLSQILPIPFPPTFWVCCSVSCVKMHIWCRCGVRSVWQVIHFCELTRDEHVTWVGLIQAVLSKCFMSQLRSWMLLIPTQHTIPNSTCPWIKKETGLKNYYLSWVRLYLLKCVCSCLHTSPLPNLHWNT